MKFATRAIRVAQDPDSDHRAVINPIYQSATFAWKSLDDVPRIDYTRVTNPNRDTLEQVLASLEGAEYCVCMSSGMAAVAGVCSLLKSGDHLLVASDIYGGTHRLADEWLTRQGIEVSFFDSCDLDSFAPALRPETKMVIFEGPTNPTLRIPNIPEIARLAKEAGVLSVFDNTFASPALQNPLALGVDVVLHSTTKYIGGHSDVIGGALLTNDRELFDHFYLYAKSVGFCPSPFDNWLTLRGLKTLSLRMERHCQNAQAVAEWLQEDARVATVYFPGLESHPDHLLAAKLMKAPGGMVSFEVNGTAEQTRRFAESTQVFLLAESLGGVESILGYPALMSHGCLSEEERLAKGIRPTLIRLSIGIEDIEDILADLDQALTNAGLGSRTLREGISEPALATAP